jgi:hypothetical protein
VVKPSLLLSCSHSPQPINKAPTCWVKGDNTCLCPSSTLLRFFFLPGGVSMRACAARRGKSGGIRAGYEILATKYAAYLGFLNTRRQAYLVAF